MDVNIERERAKKVNDELDVPALRRLTGSWEIALEAEGVSRHTLSSYLAGARAYLDWCEAEAVKSPMTDPEAVRRWLVDLARLGRAPKTRHTRLGNVRAFTTWLIHEKELSDDAIVQQVEWPALDEGIPPALTPDQVAALIGTCAGTRFAAVRDAAAVSLLFDAMLRADELLSLGVADVDLRRRTARVRRGKGGKERIVAFSAKTARRLDKYERARRRHKQAGLDAYWISWSGPLTYAGLYTGLRRRGETAGITVHPHMLRAGGAIQWRRKGGSTEGLMTIAGWTDPKMTVRYTRAAEAELAIGEAHRLFNMDD